MPKDIPEWLQQLAADCTEQERQSLKMNSEPHGGHRERMMLDEHDIYKAAGKNANKIWEIDESEGEYLVWLKDGFQIAGHNTTSFAVSEDDDFEYVKDQFDAVEAV